MFKKNLHNMLVAPLVVIGCLFSSCDKGVDPTAIKVSTSPITGSGTVTNPGGGTTNPGGGTTNPGGGTTNPGGGTTNPGGGTTNPGGGTTNPGGGTTNPGGGTTNPGGGTTTPGTVNSSGNGGVAVGAEGTITFVINNKSYTLTNSPTYVVNGVSVSALGFPLTSIQGLSANEQGVQFVLASMAATTGVTDAYMATIELGNGTSYSLGTAGKINYNTFSLSDMKVTSKGTFDLLLVNDANHDDVIRVAGSFNVK